MNGVFPTSTPEGNTSWSVVPAFPSLTDTGVPTVTVIESNPADDRLYVASRDGQIASIDNDPAVSTFEPFMDIRDRVAVVNDGGFLGLQFHPEFGTPGSPYELTFYTWTASYCPTDVAGDVDFAACDPNYPPGEPLGFFGVWMRLSRYQAFWDAGAGVYRGDPTTEEPMLNQRLYNNSHYGGGPIFGNDGYMYIAIGDHYRYETAQDIVNTLEGGTMRLAVDITENPDGSWNCPVGSHQPRRFLQTVTGNADEVSGRLYCIPDDNPWIDVAGGLFEEYWAIGQRNPHRITIDRVTGNIWSGEIGELSREEINVIRKGHNYGWPFREGTIAGVRPEPPSYVGILTEPVVDFLRTEAQSIIGGYVYRGSEYPELVGRYITGGWELSNMYAVDLDPVTMLGTKELISTFTPGGLATFGEDNDNELVMGSVSNAIPLQKLVRAGAGAPDPPPFLSQLGAFDDLATRTPAASALPYEPDQFWSDGAEKSRWLFLPNDGTHDQPDEQIGFSEVDPWTWPTGTVLMKHFELPVDELDSSQTVQLETRFLVNGTDAWYGVVYRWRPDGLEADLLTDGETDDFTIALAGGGTTQQTWTFPSRTDCLQCHNSGEGGPAGPHTHQLNRPLTFPSTGVTDNQLRTWNHLGMFSPPIVEATIPTFHEVASVLDVTASLEDRARSYLDTNCSYCHRPETGNRAIFDARITTPLADQNLVWGGVIESMGLSDPFLVKPGDVANSAIHHRTALTAAAGGMPPLAKALVDADGVAVLGAWIERVDPGYPRTGLVYEYYEETGLTGLPDFDLLTPVATGAAGLFDISARQRDDDFAFRFTGVVEVPTGGSWTFYTTSDAGSQLFIDDTLVVDNDGLHTVATEASGAITLTAGFHDIVVTVFEVAGAEVLNVDWEGPGVARQILPASTLFQVVPNLSTNAPPTLTDPGAQANLSSDTVSLQLAATDPDGDTLYYSAANLPRGLVLDPLSGLIQGSLQYATAGVTSVEISVSDGPDVSSTSVAWTITDDVAPDLDLLNPADAAVLPPIAIELEAYTADANGIASLQFLVDGVPVGPALSSAPWTTVWDATGLADGARTITVESRDPAGNLSVDSATIVLDAGAPIGAWSFDDGVGSMADDSSGREHHGVITGATWDPSGRWGGALSFDGVDDVVTVPYDTDLDLDASFTLMAWLRPSAVPFDWSVAIEKSPDAYLLLPTTPGGEPGAGAAAGGVCCAIVYGATPLAVDTWTHLAVSYDGVQLQLFRDGVFVGAAPATGLVVTAATDLLIGNSTYLGQAFEGLIDEVQIFAQALDAPEIQTRMNTAIGGAPDPDTTPPAVALTAPAPGTLVGVNAVTATASDDRGVAGVQFLLDGAPLGAEDTTPPYAIDWNTATVSDGTYALSARARDAAGNTTTSADVVVTTSNPVDVIPPIVSIDTPSEGETVSATESLTATATDDLSGVASVQFLIDGVDFGAPVTAPPWTLAWNTGLTPNGAHTVSARATDAAGNFATSAAVNVTVSNSGLLPVASWAFDDGAGTTAVDQTGNGHDGVVSGATWDPAGRFNGALSFNGVADVVTVPYDTALDLDTAFTIMAWVRPSAVSSDWSVAIEKSPDAYLLLPTTPNAAPAAGTTVGGVCCDIAYGATPLAVDTWTHLAATYDGAELELFRDGISVATVPAAGLVEVSTTDLLIGNSTYSGQAFAGLIDEVQVFDQTLDMADIQTRMNTSLGTPPAPDTTPPTVALTGPAPGTLVGVNAVTATASDDRGVVGVQFLLDGAPLDAEDTTAPYSINWNTTTVADGAYTLSARARDAAGNTTTSAGVAISVSNPVDLTPPVVSLDAPTEGETVSATESLAATATDDLSGVASVQFLIDGVDFGAPVTAPPWTLAWNTGLTPNGAHTVSARATDAAGNFATSAVVNVTVSNTGPLPVASWAFDDGAGATAADQTGNGHDGVVSGATWDPAGRFNGALSFNGAADVVTVPHDTALDLDTAFTLMAWVRPSTVSSNWSVAIEKSPDAYLLLPTTPSGAPAAGTTAGGVCCDIAYGAAPLPVDSWTHLAATYDGAQLELFRDGVSVATVTATGLVEVSATDLLIGNSSYSGQAFAGLIDEVQVFDLALGMAEIQTRMNTSLGTPPAPDTTPPTVALTAPAPGTLVGVNAVTATASDDRGVAGVQFLLDGAPLGAEDTAAPYAIDWNTTTVADGPYTLTARARDAAGNTTTSAGVSISVSNPVDLTPPIVTLDGPTEGETVSATETLTATATDDLSGVANVQFLIDGVDFGAPVTSPPWELAWNTGLTPNGVHTVAARATDAAGNFATSAVVNVTVSNTGPLPVASWAFDDGAGTTAADESGNGHDGVVTGATWDPAGRWGGALSFDGLSDVVTVPHDAALDLDTAFTLMAWVRPSTVSSNWSVAIEKSPDAYLLLPTTPSAAPAAGTTVGGVCCPLVYGGSPLVVDTWTHLAVTYDGAELELFRDGASVARAPATGLVEVSPTDLLIGNSSYSGQAFAGLIDEVQVFDLALDMTDIQTRMNTSLGTPPTPDTTPPTVALTGPAPGTLVGVNAVTATASDDRGVVGVQFLLDGAPLDAEDTVAPYEISWNTTTVADGPYTLSARARDAAGNTTTSAGVSISVSNPVDLTPPVVSLDAPTEGDTVSATESLTATATDDLSGVASVQFLIDGVDFGAPVTSPPWTLSWNTGLTPNGAHTVAARATDAAGNFATSTVVNVTVSNTGPLPVASWAFDDAAGTTATDDSGNGHDGVVSGATWDPAGRFNGALSFDGTGDVVTVPHDTALDFDTAFTLMAWLRPSTVSSNWSVAIEKSPDAYLLLPTTPSAAPAVGVTLGGTCCDIAYGAAPLVVDTWTHLAATYDGTQLEVFRDGVSVGTLTATGLVEVSPTDLLIGNSSYSGQAFAGLIDEVQIFDLALDATDIQTRMNTSIGTPPAPDTTPPTVALTGPAPGTLVGVNAVTATASDDRGVVGVQFLLDGAPLDAEDTVAPYAINWNTTTVSDGPYTLTARARDAAGNTTISAGVAISVSNPVDLTPPVVSLDAPTEGATISATETLTATATDDLSGVASVQFLIDGVDFGALVTSPPWTLAWNTGLTPNGAYTVAARATDAAGNFATSTTVNVTVSNTGPLPVASWAFDDAAGTTATDESGNGHDGVVSGATWDPAGRFNGALSFDGISDIVTVPHDAALDLDTAFTLMAWVRPSTASPSWTVAIEKSPDAYLLLPSTPDSAPAAGGTLGGVCCDFVYGATPLPIDTWTHLAATYDGTQLELFRDGVSVGTLAATGLVEVSPTDLLIGNSSYSGQAFAGLIDEVRIFGQALDAAQVQSLMNTEIGAPDPDLVPPTVALTAPAPGATLVGEAIVSATASDDRSLAGVQFLLDGAPLGAEDTAAPYAISWNTTTVTDGTYTLTARARDAAGNLTTSTGVVVTTLNPVDNTPPVITIASPTEGATLSDAVTITATATDDLSGVASVQFFVDGVAYGALVNGAPWTIGWNTAVFANGAHTVSAEATDVSGNVGTASVVNVTLSNTDPAPGNFPLGDPNGSPPAPPLPPDWIVSTNTFWCETPSCNGPWTGTVIPWPDWSAYSSNNRTSPGNRRTTRDEWGNELHPYMGTWATGCEVTVEWGNVLLIEWERGRDFWRETLLTAGDTYTINLIPPENNALIESTNAGGYFAVSLDNCNPQPLP